jgi:hypothetical protein
MSGTAAISLEWEATSPADVVQPRIPAAAASSIRESRARVHTEIGQTGEEVGFTESTVLPLLPMARPRVANFTALQEWDGYVISMNDSSFSARLTDITAGGIPDIEEVEIPFEELDETSIRRMEPGSLFRWSIGYERSPAGQKTRVSRIIIRQLPRWRKTELEKANREAAELTDAIRWQEL